MRIFRGISPCCDIFDTCEGMRDNTTTNLARRLRVSIAQSQKTAHVLGSHAEMVARAGSAALRLA
jgi:hypothetical protein